MGTTEQSFSIGAGHNKYSFTLDASTLTAARTWVVPDSDGSSGQVLTTNGSGTLSWSTATAARLDYAIAYDYPTTPAGNAVAYSVRGTAYGYGATSSADGSVAIGWNAQAPTTGSIAIGAGPIADGIRSIAIGPDNFTRTVQDASIAIGKEAVAAGLSSTAIGEGATAGFDYNFAIGQYSSTSGVNSMAIGSAQTSAIANNSGAIGVGAVSYGPNSFALGIIPQSYADDMGLAIGYYAINNSGTSTIAIGDNANSGGSLSLVIGSSASALNVGALAIGATAQSYGLASTAIGSGAQSTANDAIAIGSAASCVAINTIAIGNTATATTDAPGGIAIGNGANASGFSSGGFMFPGDDGIAIGTGAHSQKDASIAIGKDAITLQSGAVAIGENATGQDVAIGYLANGGNASFNIAIGAASAANASSTGNIAIGAGSYASGGQSISLGYYTVGYVPGAVHTGSFNANTAMSYQGSLEAFTTNATPYEVVVSYQGTSSWYLTMNNNTTHLLTCQIIGTDNTDYYAMKLEFVISRGANAASTTVRGTPVKTVITRTSGATTWDVNITADTTNGRPAIKVTGQAAKTIRWAGTYAASHVYTNYVAM